MRGDVTDAGQTTNDDEQLKIELLSQWKLEAESRKKIPFRALLTIENVSMCYPGESRSLKNNIMQYIKLQLLKESTKYKSKYDTEI